MTGGFIPHMLQSDDVIMGVVDISDRLVSKSVFSNSSSFLFFFLVLEDGLLAVLKGGRGVLCFESTIVNQVLHTPYLFSASVSLPF